MLKNDPLRELFPGEPRADRSHLVDSDLFRELTQGRGDQKVVKRIERSKQAVRKWQSLPLIQFLSGEQEMEIWGKKFDGNLTSHIQHWSNTAAQAMQNLFWNDCVFYWINLKTHERNWARIRPAATYFESDPIDDEISRLRKEVGAPEPFKKAHKIPKTERHWQHVRDVIFHITYFWEEVKGGGLMVAEGFINRKDPMNMERFNREYEMSPELVNNSIAVTSLYAYLAQSSERTIEVRQEAPKTVASSKTGQKKPWLRDDVSHIVLLDPTKAASVGCRHTGEESGRKSPAPHDRRGHWRQLQAIAGVREAKRIFVRPAWIGPTDWQHQGRIYKVVQDRKDDT